MLPQHLQRTPSRAAWQGRAMWGAAQWQQHNSTQGAPEHPESPQWKRYMAQARAQAPALAWRRVRPSRSAMPSSSSPSWPATAREPRKVDWNLEGGANICTTIAGRGRKEWLCD